MKKQNEILKLKSKMKTEDNHSEEREVDQIEVRYKG